MKILILSYFQLILLCLHSRFLNRGQYAGMAITNIFVAVLYCTIFKDLMQNIDQLSTIVSYAIGTTLGGVSGAWLHHRFWNAKEKNEKTRTTT